MCGGHEGSENRLNKIYIYVRNLYNKTQVYVSFHGRGENASGGENRFATQVLNIQSPLVKTDIKVKVVHTAIFERGRNAKFKQISRVCV